VLLTRGWLGEIAKRGGGNSHTPYTHIKFLFFFASEIISLVIFGKKGYMSDLKIIPARSVKESIEKNTSKRMEKYINNFNLRVSEVVKSLDLAKDFKIILMPNEYNEAFITSLCRSGYDCKVLEDPRDGDCLQVTLLTDGPQYR